MLFAALFEICFVRIVPSVFVQVICSYTQIIFTECSCVKKIVKTLENCIRQGQPV